jgi:pentapeptide repeat protein
MPVPTLATVSDYICNASFKNAKFNGAILSDVYVKDVVLDNADFSNVEDVEGSRWENSNWWDAKCVSQTMLTYLLKVSNHPMTPEAQSRLVSNCQPPPDK